MLKSMINPDLSVKTRPFKIIFLILVLSLFLSSMIFAGPNEDAGIRFDLDATTYGNQNLTSIPSQPAGTYIRLDVYCTEVHNLDTYEFEIIYDPTELAYVAASATNPITYEPNILTTDGGTALGWMVDTSTPGVLSIAYTLAGTDTLEAPEGEGLIADIVFQAQIPTQSVLTFGNVHFYDSFWVMDIITDKGIAILYEFGNIDGTVTNSNTGEPIEGAIISISDFSDTTGTYGTYLLEYIPLGMHDITCTAEGYYDTVDVVEVLEGQTVTIDFVLEPLPRGTLDGTVTDANNAEPIENALITATSQGKVEYTGFTNADGYYIIDSLIASEIVGNYIVICDAGVPYTLGEVTDVEIIEDETTNVDFALTAPIMVVDPLEIFPILENMGDSTVTDITVSNIGTAPFDWDAGIEYPDAQIINIPVVSNYFSRTSEPPSMGMDLGENRKRDKEYLDPVRTDILRGSTAWFRGGEYSVYFYEIFDTDFPGDMTEILSPPAWAAYCGDYSTESDEYFYVNNPDDFNIYTVDAATGIATLVGPTGLGAFLNGMACDKIDGTMYAVDGSNLYTIDLTTGTATLVGPIGNPGGLMINLACDGDGNLCGIDISSDDFWFIDKTTGAGTYIGLTGFDANYAQSMAWDPETDVIYWAAYGGGLDGNLRVVDRTTGATAFVGDFEGGREVTVLAFPGSGTPPWIVIDPTSGTIEPGGDEIVQATVYWLEAFFPGQVKYADITFTPDQNCLGEQTVSVQATFGPAIPGSISGLVTLENTPYSSGNVEDVLLTAVSQVFPSSYYTAYPDSTGEYTIPGVYPGTYDVTASLLYDYEDSTIVDVLVEEATNTPDIDFEMNCLLGALQGTVTDGYGEPIEGATITAIGDLPPSEPYCVTTNDTGYYEIDPIIGQFYNFTCEAQGFITFTDTFTVLPGETYVEDVSMFNPEIRVEPDSYVVTLAPETQTTRLITVYNDGNALLSWNADIQFPDRQLINIPPATNDFPRSEDKLSLSLAPHNGEPTNSSTTQMINPLRGTTAYGFNVYPGSDFVTFDTDTPETWLTTIPMTYSPFAADFDIDNNFYAIDSYNNNLYAVDIETGVFTLIGPTKENFTDLACDKIDGTMYASCYESGNSYLYTIDLTTGSATLIGLINTDGLIISMACDGGGNLWGFDLVADALYAIDKDDEHGTYVGSVGFDGNYAQSMAWDPESDIVYMAAYNNTEAAGQLRIVDTSTGATALVGNFNGGAEVAGLGFQGGVWLTIDPTSGYVLPGESQPVFATFDATGQTVGTVFTANIHFIPNVGQEDTVFAILIVGDIGVTGEPEILVTELYDNFPNPFSSSTIIKFSLKEATYVKLSVYNIRGQLVERLVDEDMVAGADYQVKWSGTSNDKKLANGIYFYKLEADKKTFIKKIILMR